MKIIYTQIPDVDGFRFRAVDQRCLGIHIQPTIVFHLQILLLLFLVYKKINKNLRPKEDNHCSFDILTPNRHFFFYTEIYKFSKHIIRIVMRYSRESKEKNL